MDGANCFAAASIKITNVFPVVIWDGLQVEGGSLDYEKVGSTWNVLKQWYLKYCRIASLLLTALEK